MTSLRASVARRLASASLREALVSVFMISAVGGAWNGQLRTDSLSGMLGYCLAYLAGVALYLIVVLRVLFAPLRRLAAADRRAVIDAVRFGQSVGDPCLVEPLLVYTAIAAKRARRASIAVSTALLAVMASMSAILAFRNFQLGRIGAVVTWVALAVGLALWAAIWPEVGRAWRRNIAAARQAARAFEPDPDPLIASGLR